MTHNGEIDGKIFCRWIMDDYLEACAGIGYDLGLKDFLTFKI